MNGRTAKKLRKQAGFDPHKERSYKPFMRHGRTVKSTHVATGARHLYLDLKRAYKNL